VCPSRSSKRFTGEFSWTMIAWGSCCMVAATARRGNPFDTASSVWSDDPIANSAPPVETTWAGNRVRTARQNRYVEAFLLVVTLRLSRVEATMFGLWVPVRLQPYGNETALRTLATTTPWPPSNNAHKQQTE